MVRRSISAPCPSLVCRIGRWTVSMGRRRDKVQDLGDAEVHHLPYCKSHAQVPCWVLWLGKKLSSVEQSHTRLPSRWAMLRSQAARRASQFVWLPEGLINMNNVCGDRARRGQESLIPPYTGSKVAYIYIYSTVTLVSEKVLCKQNCKWLKIILFQLNTQSRTGMYTCTHEHTNVPSFIATLLCLLPPLFNLKFSKMYFLESLEKLYERISCQR